jgi:hypothetical protein
MTQPSEPQIGEDPVIGVEMVDDEGAGWSLVISVVGIAQLRGNLSCGAAATRRSAQPTPTAAPTAVAALSAYHAALLSAGENSLSLRCAE